MAKKTSLCFVCSGNTCRSPMAQFILKAKTVDLGDKDLKITSYGTNVTEDCINPLSRLVLKKHGVKMTKFVPKQITLEKVKGYGAIVAMTDLLMEKLISEGYQNVYSVNQLTKLGDVCDPYGKDEDYYETCYNQLDKACDVILQMLKVVL